MKTITYRFKLKAPSYNVREVIPYLRSVSERISTAAKVELTTNFQSDCAGTLIVSGESDQVNIVEKLFTNPIYSNDFQLVLPEVERWKKERMGRSGATALKPSSLIIH